MYINFLVLISHDFLFIHTNETGKRPADAAHTVSSLYEGLSTTTQCWQLVFNGLDYSNLVIHKRGVLGMIVCRKSLPITFIQIINHFAVLTLLPHDDYAPVFRIAVLYPVVCSITDTPQPYDQLTRAPTVRSNSVSCNMCVDKIK